MVATAPRGWRSETERREIFSTVPLAPEKLGDGRRLQEQQSGRAIRRLKEQYISAGSALPFEPRALNVINLKGEILGYVYTSMRRNYIVMDREEDGQVKVLPPNFFLPANSAPGTVGGGGDR